MKRKDCRTLQIQRHTPGARTYGKIDLKPVLEYFQVPLTVTLDLLGQAVAACSFVVLFTMYQMWLRAGDLAALVSTSSLVTRAAIFTETGGGPRGPRSNCTKFPLEARMQTKRRAAGLQTWIAGGSGQVCPSSRDMSLLRMSGRRPRRSDGIVPRIAACEARVGVAGH